MYVHLSSVVTNLCSTAKSSFVHMLSRATLGVFDSPMFLEPWKQSCRGPNLPYPFQGGIHFKQEESWNERKEDTVDSE